MNKTAIILAGGSGTRAGGDIPKQLQLLAGKPVFIHSIERFLDQDPKTLIILTVNSHYADTFNFWLDKTREARRFQYVVVNGGSSRAESVMNALAAVDSAPGSLVAVHDAARPLASVSLIERGWQAAMTCGAAIPAVPLTDSIRLKAEDGSSMSVPRSRYVAVQTPQVFDSALLTKAYAALKDCSEVTDDASVVELAGHPVTLFDGESTNMKITGPHDLEIASLLLDKA